jgi:hypothetical protein
MNEYRDLTILNYCDDHTHRYRCLELLTRGTKHHKLIESYTKDTWDGTFSVEGRDCFLLTMKRYPTGYLLYATGHEEFSMCLPELKFNRCAEVYKNVRHGTSIRQLRDRGFRSD